MGTDKRFKDVDSIDLVRRLALYASHLFKTAGLRGFTGVMEGTGASPEDLAMQAVLEVLGDKHRKFDPKKGTLLQYLKGVVWKDFIDLLRRHSHKTSVILDPEEAGKENASHKTLVDVGDKCKEAARIEKRAIAIDMVKGDPELEEYVYAVFDVGAKSREDLAGVMRRKPSEITNMQKRLFHLISKKKATVNNEKP